MTNKEFCKRLRIAKKIAVKNYPREACIALACDRAGIAWWKTSHACNAEIEGAYNTYEWVHDHAKSTADIARVFDESIRALGEKP